MHQAFQILLDVISIFLLFLNQTLIIQDLEKYIQLRVLFCDETL